MLRHCVEVLCSVSMVNPCAEQRYCAEVLCGDNDHSGVIGGSSSDLDRINK